MKGFISRARPAALGLAASLALALSPGLGEAQTILWTGTTQGCFGGGCTPGAGPTVDATGNVSFVNGSFSVQTDGINFAGVPGTLGDNFGQVVVGTAIPAENLGSQDFTLAILFTNPTVSPDPIFSALLTGVVTITNEGIAAFDFDLTNGLEDLTAVQNGLAFFDPATGKNGTFDLGVTGTTPASGETAFFSGFIRTTSVTPEPISMTLLATGLLGLGGAAARRRRREGSEA